MTIFTKIILITFALGMANCGKKKSDDAPQAQPSPTATPDEFPNPQLNPEPTTPPLSPTNPNEDTPPNEEDQGQQNDNQSNLESAANSVVALHYRQYPELGISEVSFCTGFLISSDQIITPARCVADARECLEIVFAFDRNNVYQCRNVAYSDGSPRTSDFAIVTLNRPVIDRMPLKVSLTSASLHDAYAVIAHPNGLELSVLRDVRMEQLSQDYFSLILGSFEPDMGAVVLNLTTLDVVGLLMGTHTGVPIPPT